MKKFSLFILGWLCISVLTPNSAFSEIEKKVKISTNDSTAGYLNGKLVCGSNLTCIENNDGSNESLQLNAVASGSGITLDIADDNSNESTAISEIATSNDTYSVFSEPSADKLLINLSNKWPLSHQAVSLQTNGSNCSSGNSPLGVDASGNVESCFDVATQTELNAFVPATATSLAANGANCSSGSAPLGVDSLGASESCFDVEEEGNINTTVITGNASDDTLLNGTGSSTATWKSVPDCDDTAGNHLNYDTATNTFTCGTTGGGSGYNTIQDEGSSLTQRNTVNFTGSGMSCVDDGSSKTVCTVTTGVASAYDQMQEEGVNLTQRSALNFVGSGFTAADTGSKTELTLDGDLNGLADNSTNGIIARTASNTFTGRTITGPLNGINVADGDGVSGNPTLSLTNDLSGLEGLSGTGIAVRTASDTWTNRSIAGTSNEITVTNGSGVSGDPTVSLPATIDLSGKTSLAIPTGTSPTVDASGETAIDTTDNQLLYYSGSAIQVLNTVRTACVTLTDLTSADDNVQFFVAPQNITVTQTYCRYEGTGTTTAVIALEDANNTAMTHTAPTCTTGNTAASKQSVTASNTVAQGKGIRFDITNTPSPTTDDYTICLDYTIDRT